MGSFAAADECNNSKLCVSERDSPTVPVYAISMYEAKCSCQIGSQPALARRSSGNFAGIHFQQIYAMRSRRSEKFETAVPNHGETKGNQRATKPKQCILIDNFNYSQGNKNAK